MLLTLIHQVPAQTNSSSTIDPLMTCVPDSVPFVTLEMLSENVSPQLSVMTSFTAVSTNDTHVAHAGMVRDSDAPV